MPVVMKLCGDAFGLATPFDGELLADFDFEAHGGVGEIVTTRDVAGAKHFDTLMDAINFRNQSPKCQPLRPDGRPNRPLTSTNWSFETVDEEQPA